MMSITTKTEAEQERQKLFEEVRHYFSSKHQVPSYLTSERLRTIIEAISGKANEA